MTTEVSIILPIWNGGEIVGKRLDEILHNTRGVVKEVIAVDNGSSGDGPQLIGSLSPYQSAPQSPDNRDPRQGIEDQGEKLRSPVHL